MTQNLLLNTAYLKQLLGSETDPLHHLKDLAMRVAAVDSKYEPRSDLNQISERFYSIMQQNCFLPDLSVLTRREGVLFDQVALRPSDDFDDIFLTLKQTSLYLQNKIQVAVDFSNLRASRSNIALGSRQSLGPVRFIELFEKAPQRADPRTPLNFYLNIDHLDIETFFDYIDIGPAGVTFALGLNDEFMAALKRGQSYGLRHKIKHEISQRVSAKKVFDKVISLIFQGAQIDLYFTDRIELFQKLKQLPFEMVLNSQRQLVLCHELTAPGFINLSRFLKNNTLDETRLSQVIDDAVHFLDNCFELSAYPDQNTNQLTRGMRRIQLSVLGLVDVLSAMNPDWGENSTQRCLKHIQSFLHREAIRASQTLGDKRGMKHQIFFETYPHRTRHYQLLSHKDCSVHSQLMQATDCFAGDKPVGLLSLQKVWQEGLNNLAVFQERPAQTLNDAVMLAYDAGLLVLPYTEYADFKTLSRIA